MSVLTGWKLCTLAWVAICTGMAARLDDQVTVIIGSILVGLILANLLTTAYYALKGDG